MRKKRKAVLLALVYGAVLVGLLLLQGLTMEGSLTKFAANIATLVLTIPSFFLLKAYIRLKEMEAESKALEKAARGEKTQEQIRSDFYLQMEQAGLSNREQEVAWLLLKGQRNLQIAEELYISEATVKKHVSHIYEKTGVMSRKEFREKYQGE